METQSRVKSDELIEKMVGTSIYAPYTDYRGTDIKYVESRIKFT